MSETIEVVVQRRYEEAENIVCFDLVLPQGGQLPSFKAGAHIDVFIPETNLIRQYSLVNTPCESDRYVIAVQREVESRGGSNAMHDKVSVGSTLTISAPRNHFELIKEAPSAVLIAGGIGITPLLSMAQQLHKEEKEFALHYVTRTPGRMAFSEFLNLSSFSEKVYRYHSESQSSTFSIRAILSTLHPEGHVYVCGPSSLIDAVLNEAASLGISSTRLHREYFHADIALSTKENHAFEIKIASTGQRFMVSENESIADVLDANNIFVPVSCEEGVCGTCLTGVLDGQVDHRDVYLTDEEKKENNQLTACCSRGLSGNLILDL